MEETDFNTAINYKEVIETILNTDNRILMVDLDPIIYTDLNGNTVPKEQVTAYYTQTVPISYNESGDQNLQYTIKLEHTPILPGSVMIRVDGGKYTLRDNNNGQIFNINSILERNGSIDYITGEINLQFLDDLAQDIVINYTHNSTNVAVYKNLSTQTFYFDPSSLQGDSTQDLI